jgi:curved DNA-binding protein CbpA
LVPAAAAAGTTNARERDAIMNEEWTDLYAVLGLAPNATPDLIRHAYRDQLRRHHPDTRAPEDPTQSAAADEALHQVLTAYAVLGDPARRAKYDQQTAQRSPNPAPRPRLSRAMQDGPRGQPPIQVGPVHWHRA